MNKHSLKIHNPFMIASVVILMSACSKSLIQPGGTISTATSPGISPVTLTAAPTPELLPMTTATWTPIPRVFFTLPSMDIDVTQFIELRRYGNGGISSLKLSPNGNVVALAGGVGIWLYDRKNMDLLSHLDGQAGWVHDIDWSPDGRYLAAANENGTVQIWDEETGEIIQVFDKHQEPVLTVAWSPNGDRIASGGEDNITRVWEVNTAKELRTSTGINGGECGSCKVTDNLAWSPDGENIAITTNRSVQIWKLDQADPFYIFSAWSISDIDWSPDGHLLAIGSDEGIWVAETEDWEEKYKFSGYWIEGIAWSPMGDKIAGFTSPEGQSEELTSTVRILVYDITGKENKERVIEFSPWDGTWDDRYFITAIEWFPDGQIAFSGNGRVWFWDTVEHLVSHSLYDYFGESDIDLSPDGRQVVTSDGKLKVLFPDEGNWVHLGMNRRKVAWSPDGRKIAFREFFGLRIFDTESVRIRWYLEEDDYDNNLSDPLSFAWSPNGNYLAIKQMVNYNEAQVEIWALPENGQEHGLIHIQTLPLNASSFLIDDILWSPDGTLIAFEADFALKVFDVASNQLIKSLGSYEVNGPCHEKSWSPDGRYIANSCLSNRIIDTENWQEIWVFNGSTGLIRSIDWSPDGQYLLVGDDDGIISIWNMKSRQLVTELKGHTKSIRRAIWSATGEFIASASDDGTIRIWGLPGK